MCRNLALAVLAVFFVLASIPELLRAQAVSPPSLEGTYTGTLQAGEAQLHLVLHLAKTSTGSVSASLDSLDQSVMAIEASKISLEGSALKFEIASVGARYQGTISRDHEVIEGQWFQGSASLPLIFKRQPAGTAKGKPSGTLFPVEGVWQSALETHGLRLRFQLHVSHDLDGQLVAALDSLDQGVTGLPAIRVSQNESAFHFEIPAVAGVFDGTLNQAKDLLTGHWSQTAVDNQRLDFKRSDQPLTLRRPQNPSKPYPYREEEVSFSNSAAGVALAGTLTLPKRNSPFPAVILIAGSGPHDRDEALANHRPFLVLADHLTRKGLAVLRYDKRGIGNSTGVADAATTLDLAADAQAAFDFLKTRKDIDPAHIGLIGHSEGAIIAPYLAANSKGFAWIVLLAPPATKGEETLLNQSELIARAGGMSDVQLEVSLTFDHSAYELVRQERNPTVLAEKITALVKDTGLDSALPPAALEAQLRMLTSPWFRFFLDYDPLPNFQAVKCPVLALFGQKDLQVPSKANLPLIQKALRDAGNQTAEVRELPDLNHLFQHAYSGSPVEYAAIDETIAPEALKTISDWVLGHTSAGAD